MPAIRPEMMRSSIQKDLAKEVKLIILNSKLSDRDKLARLNRLIPFATDPKYGSRYRNTLEACQLMDAYMKTITKQPTFAKPVQISKRLPKRPITRLKG